METKALEKKVEFLTDCWYVAALSSEVPAEGMFHRRILDTSVLIYRKADGVPVALHDRCPHRFAPLHLGKRVGDEVAVELHYTELLTPTDARYGFVFPTVVGPRYNSPQGAAVAP